MPSLPFCLRIALLISAFALPLARGAERPKLVAEKWSAEINVPDPVACSVDEEGRVFVTSTTRRKTGDLDIREWTQWIPDDQSLTSIEEKAEFFHRALAPGQRPRGPLTDANHDG
jgi:quinoprotein glucose dehydrogenase